MSWAGPAAASRADYAIRAESSERHRRHYIVLAVSVLAHSTTSLFAKRSTRGSRKCWLALRYSLCLVVLFVALVLGAIDAGNAVASATGQITGTVTNAVTDAPISHIVACVREAGRSGKEECGESSALTGEYEITGVPPGQYSVLFYPVGLEMYDVEKYLSQYYPRGARVV